jgi:hypothetical protein
MSVTRLRSLCVALFVLDVAYTLTAFFVPALPGWKMFDAAEPLDVVVIDRQRVRIDVAAALPTSAVLYDRHELFRVVSFLCRRDTKSAPFFAIDRRDGRMTRFAAPKCEPDGAE